MDFRNELLKKLDSLHEQKSDKLYMTIAEISSLAPSTHNTQPWRIKFSHHNKQYKIIPQLSEWTEFADPDKRDLYISIGACVESFVLVLSALGIYSNHKIVDKSNCSIVEINLKKSKPKKISKATKGLLNALITRINYRGDYHPHGNSEKKQIEEIMSQVKQDSRYRRSKVGFTGDRQEVEDISNFIGYGIIDAYNNHNFRQEISSLINNNLSGKAVGLHGYSLRMNMLQSVALPYLIKYVPIGSVVARKNTESLENIIGFFGIASKDDLPANWINTGFVLQRILVELNRQGLSGSIYASAIEMGFREEVSNFFQPGNDKVDILIAAGRPALPMKYSKRKAISTIYEEADF